MHAVSGPVPAAVDYDVIVAGGGIAGLTAGLHSARLGRSTLVLTGGVPGGLLLSIEQIEGVPGFPDGISGYELCPLAQEQAEASGAVFTMDALESIEADGEGWRLATASGGVNRAGAVILATGSRLKELRVPGEERLQGKGVSHCASCDAPLLRDQVVAVVGGGDSALQEAMTLAQSVSQVVILHRGAVLSAQPWWQQRALDHPRISVRYRMVVEEILGDAKVSGARVRDLETGASHDLELGGVFVYVGLQPTTDLLEGRLQLDDAGRIPTDGRLRTELPGILAAGILRSDSLGQAAGSIGDGATAAVAADRYLANGSWPDQIPAPATAVGVGNGGWHG